MADWPFSRVLVANRGEIACRIISTCRRLGLGTVAVYSDADEGALHVAAADHAVRIGPAPARDSYLRIDALLAAARESGVDAVHPGYGFLSENPDFAAACEAAGLCFIGPSADVIRLMGMKDAAKAAAEQAGLRTLGGAAAGGEPVAVEAALAASAAAIGYPVLLKAVAGGGGRGMRRVDAPDALAAAIRSARREALSAFGDDRLLVERYIARARHLEVQVLADAHGNVVHLWERDCSLQRRHQKIVEEAPAPGVTPTLREALGGAAVRLCRAVGYRGVGTVEFIADAAGDLSPDRFWFMEMNTRLQVEHPVTEAITGLDLVEQQLRVAAGWPLAFVQQDVAARGHAIEARLCAEDPARNYLPSPGRLDRFELPEQARVDTGLRQGDEVGPWYDNLLAKIICHGATRDEALVRLRAALARTRAAGPATNLALLSAIAADPAFAATALHTGFLEEHRDALLGQPHAAAA